MDSRFAKHAPGATRVLWAVSRSTAALGTLLIAGVIAASASAHQDRSAANPFAGAKFFVDRTRTRTGPSVTSTTEAVTRMRLIAKIASHSSATWFGGWSSGHGSFYADVRARVAEIVADGSLPVLVAYNIPHRDCGQYSGGGASPRGLRQLGAQPETGHRETSCGRDPRAGRVGRPRLLSPARRRQRISLLRTAVRTLTSPPSISVYIDAGHESWHSSGTIAKRLRDVGIGRARGFALNVSNFYFTRDERAYGHRVSARVGGKPFVIDTSRNGRGPAPGRVWCNPPGRGLGQPATSDTGDSLVDAYLWVKLPESPTAPAGVALVPGSGWLQYALGLAERASF